MCEVSLSPNTSCVSEECQDARDLHSNSTSPDKPDCGSAGTPDIIFYVYYYGFLLLLSLINMVGNGMIIHCVLRHRRLRVPGNYFIVSLACSDLILGIVYPIYNVSHMELGAIQRTLGKGPVTGVSDETDHRELFTGALSVVYGQGSCHVSLYLNLNPSTNHTMDIYISLYRSNLKNRNYLLQNV